MDASDVVIATSRQLARRGVDRNAQGRLVRRGDLVRVAPGAYVDADAWAGLDDRGRFVLRARGVVATRPRDLLVSHRSAAVLHGLPIVGGLPDRVDALRSDVSGGRSESSIRAHRSTVPCDPVSVGEFWVTPLARTLVDVALTHSLVVSVPMIDHALLHGMLGRDELSDELARRSRHPGARRASSEQQVHLRLLSGRRAEVDCLWRGLPRTTGPGLVLEADGRYKYGPVGEALTGDAHWAEKVREDDLREQGYDFRRPTWGRVWDRAAFEAMIRGTRVPRDC